MSKVTKESLPDDFTLSLVIVDSLPVIVFSISMLCLYQKFPSMIYLLGAVLCTLAGLLKVLWKLVVVLWKRNIYFCYIQLRYLMPIGFFLILLSLAIDRKMIHLTDLIKQISQFPNCLCYIMFVASMILMGIFAKKLDPEKVRSNWIEQLTNLFGQICLLLGILL